MGKDYDRLAAVAGLEHGDDASDAATVGYAAELLAECQAGFDLFLADPGFTGRLREAVTAWVAKRQAKLDQLRALLEAVARTHPTARQIMTNAKHAFENLSPKVVAPAEARWIAKHGHLLTTDPAQAEAELAAWRETVREEVSRQILDKMNKELLDLTIEPKHDDDRDDAHGAPGGGAPGGGTRGSGFARPPAPPRLPGVPAFFPDPPSAPDPWWPAPRATGWPPGCAPWATPDGPVAYIPAPVDDFGDPRWGDGFQIPDPPGYNPPAAPTVAGGMVVASGATAVGGLAVRGLTGATALAYNTATGPGSAATVPARAATTGARAPAGGMVGANSGVRSAARTHGTAQTHSAGKTADRDRDKRKRRGLTGYLAPRADQDQLYADDGTGPGDAASLRAAPDPDRGDTW